MRNRLIWPILIFLFSCQEKSTKNTPLAEGKVIHVNLDNKGSVFSLAQVIDTIWYVPLDSHDSVAPIKNIDKLLVINNDFYVMDRKFASVKVFDHKGKYKHDIGGLGIGLGQFVKISDIVYNKFTNTFYVLCNSPARTVMEYTLDGAFIAQHHMRNGSMGMAVKNSNMFYYFLNRGGEGKYKEDDLVVCDSTNGIKGVLFDVPKNIATRIAFTGGMYVCGSNLFFNPPLTNIYYSLTDEGTAKVAYSVSFGKDNLPAEFKSLKEMIKGMPNYSYMGTSFVKGSDFIGFNYIAKGGLLNQAFYNTSSQNIALSDTANAMNYLFKNEVFQTNDTLITMGYVPDLKAWAANHDKAIKKEISGFYHDINLKTEHDNPVLIFYKLKHF